MVADDKDVGSRLVKALIEAKKKFGTLVKNKVNPHFRSKYADLAAVHEAVDDALAANGLTVMQPLMAHDGGLWIHTELLHVSGEMKTAVYPLPGGVKSQELASAITYGRRYSLSSLLGIAADDEDDDAEAAEGRSAPKPQAQEETRKMEPPPKAAPAKSSNTGKWSGLIEAVDGAGNGKWKITGKDGEALYTAIPEHADVARGGLGKLTKINVVYVVQGDQKKRIMSIEPDLNGGGK